MKWFAAIDTDWNYWDFGLGLAWHTDEFYGAKVMLGPWSFLVGRDRPLPPFDPDEWGTIEIPVEMLRDKPR